MKKYQRARRRITRDRMERELKRNALYSDYDNFNKVITMQHMCESLKKCRRNVNWKGAIQDYTAHAIERMYTSYTSLHENKFPNSVSAHHMILNERGKLREIVPITIYDRIIQRVLCDYSLVPTFKNGLIYDNCASLQGKGVKFARDRIMNHLRCAIKKYGSDFYILTFDFKDFFGSIQHSLCLNELNKIFNDERIKRLTMTIIESYERAEIKLIPDISLRGDLLRRLDSNISQGLCLGSQVSQIMALAAPNMLDHFIKDKCAIKYYVRYMDDGIIISNSKKYLQSLLLEIKVICNQLGLVLNEKKTKISKSSKGFTFLKIRYRVMPTGKVIYKLTREGIVRMRRKLKRLRRLVDNKTIDLDDVYNSMQSWLAYSSAAMSYQSKRNMLKLYNQLFNGYRITKKWKYMEGGRSSELL